ncbi:uncharacterized protein BDR25DRAFT_225486, partial [Lindgomyces ingoldianus]
TRFATLSLYGADQLRFFLFPTRLESLIRATILSSWPRGISSSSTTSVYLDFRLKGLPWGTSTTEMRLIRNAMGDYGVEQSIQSKRLVCSILAALRREGWMLTLTTDISKSPHDKDTLVFQHQTPAPAPCDWISIAFSGTNRLRFIDAPMELCEAVIKRLGKAVEKHKRIPRVEGAYELKLQGVGWGVLVDDLKTRWLVMDLLEVMEDWGWSVYASVDQKLGFEDKDSWHCYRVNG